MKKLITAAFLIAAAAGAMAQTVDVQLGGSGYYGRIDLGNLGAPPLIYQQPQWVDRTVRYDGAPTYMRVPPGHAKKWSKHCSRYNACNRPVYFVQDNWYSNTYVPEYRKIKGHRGNDRMEAKYEDRGHSRVDYRSDDRDHNGGKGDKHDKGHGGGKDKGHKGHGNGKH